MTANDNNSDSFFTLTMSSRYAVPVSYLGNATRASTVADSILFHHRILVVQYMDHNWHFGNYSMAKELVYVGLATEDEPTLFATNANTVFNATAHDPTGRSRVVQDMASTRIPRCF